MADEIQPGPLPQPEDEHLREPPPGFPSVPLPPMSPDAIRPPPPPGPEERGRQPREYDFRKRTPMLRITMRGLLLAGAYIFLGYLGLGILFLAICSHIR